MEQEINSVTSAETNDDNSAIADVTTSSPNNAKPNVGRLCFLFVDTYLVVLVKLRVFAVCGLRSKALLQGWLGVLALCALQMCLALCVAC